MMKKIAVLCLALVMSACSAQPETLEAVETMPDLVAPNPIAPNDAHVFIESDVEVAWEWSPLSENQAFVLRVWHEDNETPQEVWLQESAVNIQQMIDSFSRDVGKFEWQVAVVNTNEDGGFDAMGSEWSPVQTLERVRRLPLEPVPYEQLSDVARLVTDQAFETATDKIVYLQNWMQTHTNVGNDLAIYQPDYSDAVQAMFDFSQGTGEPPEMYCNGLSTSLLTVLLELGMESRAVFLYGEVPGWIAQHTILEVFNPDTQTWQVYDPTINIFYRHAGTQEQVAMRDLVFGDLGEIEACDINGDCSLERGTEAFQTFSGAYRYGNSAEIFVNPERLNLARRVDAFDDMTFAEFISDFSSIPVNELLFRFDA